MMVCKHCGGGDLSEDWVATGWKPIEVLDAFTISYIGSFERDYANDSRDDAGEYRCACGKSAYRLADLVIDSVEYEQSLLEPGDEGYVEPRPTPGPGQTKLEI